MIPSVAFSDVVTSLTSTGTSSSKGSAPDSGAFGDLLASLATVPAPVDPLSADTAAADMSAADASEPPGRAVTPEPDSSVLLQLLSVLGLMPQAKVPVVEAMPAVVAAPAGEPATPIASTAPAPAPMPVEPAAKSVITPPVVDVTSTVIDVTDPAAPATPPVDAPVVDTPPIADGCAVPTADATPTSEPSAPATTTTTAATTTSTGTSAPKVPVHGARARFERLRNARKAAAVDATATETAPDAPVDAEPAPARPPVRRRDPFAGMDTHHAHPPAPAPAPAPAAPVDAETPIGSEDAMSTKVDATASNAPASHASPFMMKAASSITTEATSAVSTEQTPQPQPWEQVVSAMKPLRKFSDGSHRLAVQLHPDDLGTVHVELSLHKGQLNVHMVANNDAARDALMGSLHELRSDLEASGVHAASIHVGNDTMRADGTGVAGNTPTTQYTSSSSGSSLTPNQQQNLADGSWQQSNRRRAFSMGNRDDADATVVDVAAIAQAANATSNLDLRI